MATLTASPGLTRQQSAVTGHRLRVTLAGFAAAGFVLFFLLHGYSYYFLALEDRPLSPLHAELRPSGSVGLKLGVLGVCLFGILFLYPLRKRWQRLNWTGNTRYWLDYHAIIGITAPLVITLHSSFKLGGVAGLSYWIMIVVALSGFVGRYVYAQIPRSLNSAQLSLGELEVQTEALAARLREQNLFHAEDLAPLFAIPSAEAIRAMSLPALLWSMLRLDLSRPFLVSRLRRRALGGKELARTLGGFLTSHNQQVEWIVDGVRRQSWLRTKTAFLERAQGIFHLWHVIHRPFSLSFVVLVMVHIAVVLLFRS